MHWPVQSDTELCATVETIKWHRGREGSGWFWFWTLWVFPLFSSDFSLMFSFYCISCRQVITLSAGYICLNHTPIWELFNCLVKSGFCTPRNLIVSDSIVFVLVGVCLFVCVCVYWIVFCTWSCLILHSIAHQHLSKPIVDCRWQIHYSGLHSKGCIVFC